jgi:hypothetical protein
MARTPDYGSFGEEVDPTTFVTLGASQTTTLGGFVTGCIDNFRVWNRVLTDAEIVDYKDTDFAGPQPNLLLNMRFNELVDAEELAYLELMII